ncbi:unnamed protein product [Ectocarpus sp. 8 AP-2014]
MIMFEPNISIDVSLLAIILGLYATRNDKNLILVLICILFAHILLTDDDDGVVEHARTAAATDDDDDDLGAAVPDAVQPQPAAETRTTVAENENTVTESAVATGGFKSTLSSGVFDRQMRTPQTNLTSTVFPATSEEANGKLASARDSFFDSLVS